MNAIRLALLGALLGTQGAAATLDDIINAANASFDRMPQLAVVDRIAGYCGADAAVNPVVAYCTSENVVRVAASAVAEPQTAYLLAHVLGHAAQVQHGVADVALATITANREQEDVLRADVTRQVDCIAGTIYARAGGDTVSLATWFSSEPLTDSHWGRNPLTIGPKVSIGLAERDRWFQRGQASGLAACATPNFNADLLIAADQGG